MSSFMGGRLMEIVKFTFKAMQYRFEQNRLTTYIFATVMTAKGAVKGVKRKTVWDDEYYSFEGIPYAKPPLGELRFKAPEPAEPWQTMLDCTRPAEMPIQTSVIFKKYKGSEDCLYLNVFTKDLAPEKPRPVMVWIYGGGFQLGEATRDMYSPDFLMSKDVVVVTIAYRLGALGFLSLSNPIVNVPGNAGLKDQIMGLKWVQENIAAFGGDPNNVTLFGESAGGASTHFCMLSDQSKGLLHKAIVMSGSVLCPWANPPNNQYAFRLAKLLGYEGAKNDIEVFQFLQSAKGSDIVLATSKVLNKEEKHKRILFAFGPTVEPYLTEHCVIPEPPRTMLENAWSKDLPLMIGGTSFEGLLLYPEVIRRPATLDEVRNCNNLLPADLGLSDDSKEVEEFALKMKAAYFGDNECSRSTMMEFLDLESYREFWHPIQRTVQERLRSSNAPTYLYRFDYDSKDGNVIRKILCGPEQRGVCHGDDLTYLFRAIFSYRAEVGSSEERMTRTMVDIWTSFADNSDPNCEILGEVKFEPLAKDTPLKCLNLSEKTEFIELPELTKLKVWDSLYAESKL